MNNENDYEMNENKQCQGQNLEVSRVYGGKE
jgi:hypothetical protein